MTILLIGATGFIGSHVTRLLVEGGHQVTLFHRGQTKMEVPLSVREVLGDRRQMAEFREEFEAADPHVVVDMLAMVEEDARQLVDSFRGIARRSVVISSMDVYRAYGQLIGIEDGEPEPVPFDEDAPQRSTLYPYRKHSKEPGDFLDRYDKILVEQIVSSEPDLPATILRLPAVYGPGDKQHRVGSYLKEMSQGEVRLSAAQAQWKWTRGYVEDVAGAIALAATNENAKGRIYNVGEARAITEEEWIGAIARAANWNGPITAEEDSETADHDFRFHLVADTSRIRRELGFTESFSMEEALIKSVEWERAQKENRAVST